MRAEQVSQSIRKLASRVPQIASLFGIVVFAVFTLVGTLVVGSWHGNARDKSQD